MLVATRYAQSLLQFALEKSALEKVYADMQLVVATCQDNKELSAFLNSPIIKTDKKTAVIKQIFSEKVSDITLGFFTILTQKRRESYISEIAKNFISQYKEHKNILTAVITSASGIDAHVRTQVLNLIKQSTQSEVELLEKTDKSLIGGFVLRIGDKQVDASVARKLNELRKTFTTKILN
ncbi:MAG: ATP synthase F1 subunit delta [Bacteroidetes bacterium]|nr:ATP synthase F1 subunit delta [Bacteroidota bacterium]